MRIALKRSLPILLFLALLQSPLQGQPGTRSADGNVAAPDGPADEVNPFVGTAPVPAVEGMKAGVFDTGNTYPGAALPFGMVQWSPDTATGFIKRRTELFLRRRWDSRLQPKPPEWARVPDYGRRADPADRAGG